MTDSKKKEETKSPVARKKTTEPKEVEKVNPIYAGVPSQSKD